MRAVMGVMMSVVMMVLVMRRCEARAREQTQCRGNSDELGHDSVQPA